ncbi:uncharacterized protein LOC127364670 isoform X10 [Dicentrarchus labrax]|uniref:uncharacterized protein LOC127364670 isoform X10 n=1 Tax=Dicentrarchus labrax TaxID=13489 RepID=UPI0021F56C51|nr:uncharacterized protein LOC127364670 isoform X10 [Dicentrarchus labrax]
MFNLQETYSHTQAVFTQTHLHCTAIDFTFDNMGAKVSKAVPETNRRIVMLGETGAGKSSLANTIFGENVFKVDHGLNSGTKKCQTEAKSVNGKGITLIDTPGFLDTDSSEEELICERVRCITECAPGPHAFLIVLKYEKFTKQKQEVINKINKHCSEEVFKYATVVFTYGDQLPEGQTIEDHVRKNELVNDLVKKCGGRCFVVDNKYWNKKHKYRSNKFQVVELLKSIDKMVKESNGSCYTNEILQAVEEEIQQEDERQRPGNMSEEEIREQAKCSVFKKIPTKLAESAVASSTMFDPAADPHPQQSNDAFDIVSKTVTETDRRIVIFGKTAAGKSSLANTIFGEDVFKIDHSLNSTTKKCQAETRSVNGRSITLIDTPGFCDMDRSEDIEREIVRYITECAPGPHAFLFVFKVEKFTEHEQEVIKETMQYFSEEAFKYATVVFTHGDQLPKGKTIKDFIRKNKLVSNLVKKCGGRCFVIDNKYWNKNPKDEYRSNQFQVEELLKSIDKIVKANNGSYYTNEMLQAVQKEIQQEEENLKQSSRNMSEEEIREQAKVTVSTKIWIRLAGTTTGALLGTLFGVVVVGAVCVTVGRNCKDLVGLAKSVAGGAAAVAGGTSAGGTAAVAEGAAVVAGGAAAVAEGAAAVAGGTSAGGTAAVAGGAAGGGTAAVVVVGTVAAVGGVLGGMRGSEAAEGADTALEAIKRAAVAVTDDAKSVYDAFDKMFTSKSTELKPLKN